MYAEHRLDVYGTKLILATRKKDWKKLTRRFTWLDKSALDVAGQTTFHSGNGGTVVLWVHKKIHADTLELIDTAAHEASHAAGCILESIGHHIPATDEPHAYLVGWLTRWIWEHCNAA